MSLEIFFNGTIVIAISCFIVFALSAVLSKNIYSSSEFAVFAFALCMLVLILAYLYFNNYGPWIGLVFIVTIVLTFIAWILVPSNTKTPRK